MGELLRRRAMMAAASGGSTPIDCPYITDGLIFWLDGLNQGGVSGEWKDLIGGKVFELTACSQNANGVYFDGSSSYGRTLGAISSNWKTETIEVAIVPAASSGSAPSFAGKCLFCPSADGVTYGVGMIFTADGAKVGFGMDGSNTYRWTTTETLTKISGCNARTVIDGVSKSHDWGTTYSNNSSEYTYLGARYLSAIQQFFKGTIHSVRIYNRQLTADEMLANQAVDVTRFYS